MARKIPEISIVVSITLFVAGPVMAVESAVPDMSGSWSRATFGFERPEKPSTDIAAGACQQNPRFHGCLIAARASKARSRAWA